MRRFTRDPESIDKLTSTRMMLASSASLLVYTLFPMFIADGGAEDRSLKDTGFSARLNLGSYTDPSANYAQFGVYCAIYMIISAVACLSALQMPRQQ